MAQRPFSGTFARNPKPAAQNAAESDLDVQQAATKETALPKDVSMQSDVSASLQRLGNSVQHLRAAVEYRLKLDENQGELRSEFNKMNDERKRLAARLDQAEGRGQAMQQVNQDVSRRLGAAMETIRTVLENQAQ